MTTDEQNHYTALAERLERLAYDLRQRSESNVIDVLEAAQFLRDTVKDAPLRATLQAVMQVLGPSAVCHCAGCAWETTEAIRLLKAAGITYIGRQRHAGPPHDPEAERRGN